MVEANDMTLYLVKYHPGALSLSRKQRIRLHQKARKVHFSPREKRILHKRYIRELQRTRKREVPTEREAVSRVMAGEDVSLTRTQLSQRKFEEKKARKAELKGLQQDFLSYKEKQIRKDQIRKEQTRQRQQREAERSEGQLVVSKGIYSRLQEPGVRGLMAEESIILQEAEDKRGAFETSYPEVSKRLSEGSIKKIEKGLEIIGFSKWFKDKRKEETEKYAEFVGEKEFEMARDYPKLPEKFQQIAREKWAIEFVEERKKQKKESATGIKKLFYKVSSGFDVATEKVREIPIGKYKGHTYSLGGYLKIASRGWEIKAGQLEKSQLVTLKRFELPARGVSSVLKFVSEKPITAGAYYVGGYVAGAITTPIAMIGKPAMVVLGLGSVGLMGTYGLGVTEKYLGAPGKQAKIDIVVEEAIKLIALGKGFKGGGT